MAIAGEGSHQQFAFAACQFSVSDRKAQERVWSYIQLPGLFLEPPVYILIAGRILHKRIRAALSSGRADGTASLPPLFQFPFQLVFPAGYQFPLEDRSCRGYLLPGQFLRDLSCIVEDSIAQVCAEYEFKSTLSQTTVVTAPLVFYDSSGNKVDTRYITYDTAKVDATIPILKLVTVGITPSITNMPDTLNISDKINVEPGTIKLAVPNNSSNITEVSTENIDFSKVDLSNHKFEVGLSTPSGSKNINGIEKATVTFDTSDMETKTLTVTNFNVINEGDDQTTSVSTQSLNVTLIGSKDQLSSITSSNITAVIDMSAKAQNFIGMAEMPVSIKINSKFNSCWAYGSYTVNVTSSRKSETSQ